jgi:hypothetical protein
MLKTREDYIIHHLPQNTDGAELGVFEGEFSRILKNSNKFQRLYLVDIFEGTMYSGDKNGNNGKTIDLNVPYQQLLEQYKNCSVVSVIKNTSSNFLNSLKDDSLDFVYIDADHSYTAVVNDLEISRSKVRKNGIISGHDYNKIHFAGVFNAVNEFINKYDLEAVFTEEDNLASYFIVNKK